MVKTVGELKALLANANNDAPIAMVNSVLGCALILGDGGFGIQEVKTGSASLGSIAPVYLCVDMEDYLNRTVPKAAAQTAKTIKAATKLAINTTKAVIQVAGPL